MPTHKFLEKRDFGPVLFFCPLSEIKNGFQDYFVQAKTKIQNEKIFFPKYAPGSMFLSEEKYKVYSLFAWREKSWEGLHPHLKQRAANRRRGRSFYKEKLLQKIFVQIDEKK